MCYLLSYNIPIYNVIKNGKILCPIKTDSIEKDGMEASAQFGYADNVVVDGQRNAEKYSVALTIGDPVLGHMADSRSVWYAARGFNSDELWGEGEGEE